MTRALALGLVVVLALGTAACGSENADAAATVNGTEISDQQVLDELAAIAANPDYVDRIFTSSGVRVHGPTEGSFDTTFTAQVLQRQIAFVLVEQELAKRGLEVTDSCRAVAERDLKRQLGAEDESLGAQTLASFPANYREQSITWNADLVVLQSDLAHQPCDADAAARQYYDAHTGEFEQLCASHILVGTEEAANSLYDQLQAGADFASLAAQYSSDGTRENGGSLGCAPRGSFVQEFEDAAYAATPGVVTKPVQTQFGWHLILVDSVSTPELVDIRDQVDRAVASELSQAFSEWISGTYTAADITVDSKYGTWDGAGKITPPETSGTTAPSSTSTSGP